MIIVYFLGALKQMVDTVSLLKERIRATMCGPQKLRRSRLSGRFDVLFVQAGGSVGSHAR